MMYRILLALIFVSIQALQGIEISQLEKTLQNPKPPFSYPLDIKIIKGDHTNENVILCCHGYGSNSGVVEVIASHHPTSDHLVGFNFPDYNISLQNKSPSIKYGTIDELLPALYMLKSIVVRGGANSISLYGFSAGGGAVVNIVGILNTSDYDPQLEAIGITSHDKQVILDALQKGVILLDVPLKSIEEIIASLPKIPGDDIMIRNYSQNNMRPIDALEKWQGLQLNVVLFFQNPDESLTNRDDQLFAQRLRRFNPKGRNKVLITDEGGHRGFHYSLWNTYNNLKCLISN